MMMITKGVSAVWAISCPIHNIFVYQRTGQRQDRSPKNLKRHNGQVSLTCCGPKCSHFATQVEAEPIEKRRKSTYLIGHEIILL